MNQESKKTTPAQIVSEVKVGRITFMSKEKGAFVEVLGTEKEKKEEFVPANIMAQKNLSENKLVRLKKAGDTITDIDPL